MILTRERAKSKCLTAKEKKELKKIEKKINDLILEKYTPIGEIIISYPVSPLSLRLKEVLKERCEKSGWSVDFGDAGELKFDYITLCSDSVEKVSGFNERGKPVDPPIYLEP